MRIRKHAKVSPLLYTSSTPQDGVVLQNSTICQLNQSPWDVITFSPQEYSSCPPPPPPLHHHQVEEEEEESLLGNGSFCDSIGASESEASMKLSIDDDEVAAEEMEEEDEKFCERIDGKGWQCHRKAKSGETLCEHHKSLEHSRRGRPKKGSTSTYPNGYYYYTGFGPRWGKRRGPNKDSSANDDPDATEAPIRERESDYMEEEEEEEEEEGEEDSGNGKKRARKPIKARSLKSLM